MSEEPQKRSLFGRLFGRGAKPAEETPRSDEKPFERAEAAATVEAP